MTQTTKPDKCEVRACMDERTYPEHDDPPPSTDEIRRELGWELIPHNNDREDQP